MPAWVWADRGAGGEAALIPWAHLCLFPVLALPKGLSPSQRRGLFRPSNLQGPPELLLGDLWAGHRACRAQAGLDTPPHTQLTRHCPVVWAHPL